MFSIGEGPVLYKLVRAVVSGPLPCPLAVTSLPWLLLTLQSKVDGTLTLSTLRGRRLPLGEDFEVAGQDVLRTVDERPRLVSKLGEYFAFARGTRNRLQADERPVVSWMKYGASSGTPTNTQTGSVCSGTNRGWLFVPPPGWRLSPGLTLGWVMRPV